MSFGDFWIQQNNSRKERLQAPKEAFGKERLEPKFAHLFDFFDKDRNGKLNAEEMEFLSYSLSAASGDNILTSAISKASIFSDLGEEKADFLEFVKAISDAVKYSKTEELPNGEKRIITEYKNGIKDTIYYYPNGDFKFKVTEKKNFATIDNPEMELRKLGDGLSETRVKHNYKKVELDPDRFVYLSEQATQEVQLKNFVFQHFIDTNTDAQKAIDSVEWLDRAGNVIKEGLEELGLGKDTNNLSKMEDGIKSNKSKVDNLGQFVETSQYSADLYFGKYEDNFKTALKHEYSPEQAAAFQELTNQYQTATYLNQCIYLISRALKELDNYESDYYQQQTQMPGDNFNPMSHINTVVETLTQLFDDKEIAEAMVNQMGVNEGGKFDISYLVEQLKEMLESNKSKLQEVLGARESEFEYYDGDGIHHKSTIKSEAITYEKLKEKYIQEYKSMYNVNTVPEEVLDKVMTSKEIGGIVKIAIIMAIQMIITKQAAPVLSAGGAVAVDGASAAININKLNAFQKVIQGLIKAHGVQRVSSGLNFAVQAGFVPADIGLGLVNGMTSKEGLTEEKMKEVFIGGLHSAKYVGFGYAVTGRMSLAITQNMSKIGLGTRLFNGIKPIAKGQKVIKGADFVSKLNTGVMHYVGKGAAFVADGAAFGTFDALTGDLDLAEATENAFKMQLELGVARHFLETLLGVKVHARIAEAKQRANLRTIDIIEDTNGAKPKYIVQNEGKTLFETEDIDAATAQVSMISQMGIENYIKVQEKSIQISEEGQKILDEINEIIKNGTEKDIERFNQLLNETKQLENPADVWAISLKIAELVRGKDDAEEAVISEETPTAETKEFARTTNGDTSDFSSSFEKFLQFKQERDKIRNLSGEDKFMQFLKVNNPREYERLQRNPILLKTPTCKEQIADLEKLYKLKDTIEDCRDLKGTKKAEDIYENYLQNEYASENPKTAEHLKDLCRQINKDFGVKVFLPSNLKEAGVALKLIYQELSCYKMHAQENGAKAELPPTLEFFVINEDFAKDKTIMGGCSSFGDKHIQIRGLSIGTIKEFLRHELAHANEQKHLSKFPRGFNPKQYAQMFRDANIPDGLIEYGQISPAEFLATAAQGDMSKYPQELKDALKSLGMPEWMFNMPANFTKADLAKVARANIEYARKSQKPKVFELMKEIFSDSMEFARSEIVEETTIAQNHQFETIDSETAISKLKKYISKENENYIDYIIKRCTVNNKISSELLNEVIFFIEKGMSCGFAYNNIRTFVNDDGIIDRAGIKKLHELLDEGKNIENAIILIDDCKDNGLFSEDFYNRITSLKDHTWGAKSVLSACIFNGKIVESVWQKALELDSLGTENGEIANILSVCTLKEDNTYNRFLTNLKFDESRYEKVKKLLENNFSTDYIADIIEKCTVNNKLSERHFNNALKLKGKISDNSIADFVKFPILDEGLRLKEKYNIKENDLVWILDACCHTKDGQIAGDNACVLKAEELLSKYNVPQGSVAKIIRTSKLDSELNLRLYEKVIELYKEGISNFDGIIEACTKTSVDSNAPSVVDYDLIEHIKVWLKNDIPAHVCIRNARRIREKNIDLSKSDYLLELLHAEFDTSYFSTIFNTKLDKNLTFDSFFNKIMELKELGIEQAEIIQTLERLKTSISNNEHTLNTETIDLIIELAKKGVKNPSNIVEGCFDNNGEGKFNINGLIEALDNINDGITERQLGIVQGHINYYSKDKELKSQLIELSKIADKNLDDGLFYELVSKFCQEPDLRQDIIDAIKNGVKEDDVIEITRFDSNRAVFYSNRISTSEINQCKKIFLNALKENPDKSSNYQIILDRVYTTIPEEYRLSVLKLCIKHEENYADVIDLIHQRELFDEHKTGRISQKAINMLTAFDEAGIPYEKSSIIINVIGNNPINVPQECINRFIELAKNNQIDKTVMELFKYVRLDFPEAYKVIDTLISLKEENKISQQDALNISNIMKNNRGSEPKIFDNYKDILDFYFKYNGAIKNTKDDGEERTANIYALIIALQSRVGGNNTLDIGTLETFVDILKKTNIKESDIESIIHGKGGRSIDSEHDILNDFVKIARNIDLDKYSNEFTLLMKSIADYDMRGNNYKLSLFDLADSPETLDFIFDIQKMICDNSERPRLLDNTFFDIFKNNNITEDAKNKILYYIEMAIADPAKKGTPDIQMSEIAKLAELYSNNPEKINEIETNHFDVDDQYYEALSKDKNIMDIQLQIISELNSALKSNVSSSSLPFSYNTSKEAMLAKQEVWNLIKSKSKKIYFDTVELLECVNDLNKDIALKAISKGIDIDITKDITRYTSKHNNSIVLRMLDETNISPRNIAEIASTIYNEPQNYSKSRHIFAEKLIFADKSNIKQESMKQILEVINIVNVELADKLCFDEFYKNIPNEIISKILLKTQKSNFDIANQLCEDLGKTVPIEFIPDILSVTKNHNIDLARTLCFDKELDFPKDKIAQVLDQCESVNLNLSNYLLEKGLLKEQVDKCITLLSVTRLDNQRPDFAIKLLETKKLTLEEITNILNEQYRNTAISDREIPEDVLDIIDSGAYEQNPILKDTRIPINSWRWVLNSGVQVDKLPEKLRACIEKYATAKITPKFVEQHSKLYEDAYARRDLLKTGLDDLTDAEIDETFMSSEVLNTLHLIGRSNLEAAFPMMIDGFKDFCDDVEMLGRKLTKENHAILVEKLTPENTEAYKTMYSELSTMKKQLNEALGSENLAKIRTLQEQKLPVDEQLNSLNIELKTEWESSTEYKQMEQAIREYMEQNGKIDDKTRKQITNDYRKQWETKPNIDAKLRLLKDLQKQSKLLGSQIQSIYYQGDNVNQIKELMKQISIKSKELKNYLQEHSLGLDPQQVVIKMRVLSALRNIVTHDEMKDFIDLIKPPTKENNKAWNDAVHKKIFEKIGIEFDEKLANKLNLIESKYLSQMFVSSEEFFENMRTLVNIVKENIDKPIEEILDNMQQNIETRRQFAQLGIDYDRFTKVDKESYSKVQVVLSAEDAKQSAMNNLLKDLNSENFKKLPKEVREPIFKSLKEKLGITFEKSRIDNWVGDGMDAGSTEFYRLYKNGKPIIFEDMSDIVHILRDEVNKLEFWTKTHSDPEIEAAKADMYTHLIKMRSEEVENAINIKDGETADIEIRKTDMYDIKKALGLGNDAQCCTALGRNFNEWSAPTYIMNKCIGAIELNDRGNFVGNTMIYIAYVDGKPALVLDNIELKTKYQNNDKIRDTFVEYAKKLCIEIGQPDLPIYAGPNRHKLNMDIYTKAQHEMEVIGSTGDQIIYIDYDAKPHYVGQGEKVKINMYQLR